MKMMRKDAVGIMGIAVFIAALCCVALAADLSDDAEPAAVDAAQYADFMSEEVLDLQDLAQWAEIQRRFFNRITPADDSLFQPMSPPVVPFDAANYADDFLKELLGEDMNSVAVYPLSLALDPETRETLIYNADGKLIAAVSQNNAFPAVSEGEDPSRVMLQLDLLPTEDVEPYLYVERRVAESLAAAEESTEPGGAAMMSLEEGEFGFVEFQSQTNGTMRLTVTNGAGTAEVFSYTVWHTADVVVVTYTNEESNVVTDTNTLWYPISPPYNGMESAWTNRTTNLACTNGVGAWEDANVISNARVRFYAVTLRTDTDGDGLTDGAETFVHHTNPGTNDTDGDGIWDGWEVLYGLNTSSNDALLDPDGDGRSNIEEFNYSNSTYYTACIFGDSNPTNKDTDGDGVTDGPLGGGGAYTNGPAAFPRDPCAVADTDCDGQPDALTCTSSLTEDADDDNDGIPDTNETTTLERIIPITVAPFKVVVVESTDPAGDDSGTEVFDVSSAGRMLPYATGGDARGHGQIHGGIFFNHDGTNLYVGVAGLEKNGNNALMIYLDTDGTNGGAASLAGISNNPSAFGQANNLSFSSANFTPNVGILVGDRYADGKNDISSMGLGQGVYRLTPTTVSNFPGFTSSSGAISQWGDRGTNSANAGVEIKLALTNLGLSASNTFKAAAIICGGTWGANDRWFSGECYGESASGTLTNNNFESSAITLIGAQVFLSGVRAPTPSAAPPVDDDDVMLQGYYWKVPFVPTSNTTTMTLTGNLNGWNPSLNNMVLVGNYTWEYIHTFTAPTSGVMFKFTANGAWDLNWGDNTLTNTSLPITNEFADSGGNNITIPGTVSGLIRFRINTDNPGMARYNVESVTNGTVTKLLQGYSTNFWYPQLTQLAQTGRLSKFTMVWMPPPQKCNSGRNSVGYDPFDYYDIGTYAEKFSVETRYGSEAHLKTCVAVMQNQGILPIVDLVMNHMNGGYTAEGGTNRYNYQPEYHEIFEKPDLAGNNTNQYFNVNYGNQPFSYDANYGNPDGVNAWDASATSADVNQRHPYQRHGLKNWASWASGKAGYRGYRWDVAQNIEPWFISELMSAPAMKDQFSVMEYWADSEQATVKEFETWAELTDRRAAMFDQRLYFQLEEMCNQNGTFDMSILRNGGLFAVKPQWAVTLAGDHDKIRPYGEDGKLGIKQNKPMAYAFILMSEGTPMVSYNDYFIGWKADQGTPDDAVDDGWTGGVLTNEIDRLVEARTNFAGGSTTYLSTVNTNDLFIMKRTGNGIKPGCILVLNDHMTLTLSNTVNTGWTSTTLVDFINTNVTVNTDPSGNATLSAPPRGYRVFVRQGDL
ncbi:MAG: hypothetical protein GX548_06430 [Lentisphaerae bacterium]|nr:hypothetical protein [Lentisphaerota bacterium]